VAAARRDSIDVDRFAGRIHHRLLLLRLLGQTAIEQDVARAAAASRCRPTIGVLTDSGDRMQLERRLRGKTSTRNIEGDGRTEPMAVRRSGAAT
jgi:hypothetical protein